MRFPSGGVRGGGCTEEVMERKREKEGRRSGQRSVD